MTQYSVAALKADIAAVIKSNGTRGITGPVLQEKLFNIIDSSLNKETHASLVGLANYNPDPTIIYKSGSACIYRGRVKIAREETSGAYNPADWADFIDAAMAVGRFPEYTAYNNAQQYNDTTTNKAEYQLRLFKYINPAPEAGVTPLDGNGDLVETHWEEIYANNGLAGNTWQAGLYREGDIVSGNGRLLRLNESGTFESTELSSEITADNWVRFSINEEDIADLDKYTQAEVDALLAGLSPKLSIQDISSASQSWGTGFGVANYLGVCTNASPVTISLFESTGLLQGDRAYIYQKGDGKVTLQLGGGGTLLGENTTAGKGGWLMVTCIERTGTDSGGVYNVMRLGHSKLYKEDFSGSIIEIKNSVDEVYPANNLSLEIGTIPVELTQKVFILRGNPAYSFAVNLPKNVTLSGDAIDTRRTNFIVFTSIAGRIERVDNSLSDIPYLLHYVFDDNADDLTSNENDGTINGTGVTYNTATSPPGDGKAVDFRAATGAYVQAPIAFRGCFSFYAVCYFTSTAAGNGLIFCNTNTATGARQNICFIRTDGVVRLTGATDSSYVEATGAPTDQYILVAGSYNPSTGAAKLYMNSSTPVTGTLTTVSAAGNPCFGGNPANFLPFDGLLDDVGFMWGEISNEMVQDLLDEYGL